MLWKLIISAILIGTLAAGPAWAIKSATKAVPGKAAEADLGKAEGRTIWKIEVIDNNNKSQTVYVDAQTGVAKMNK